MRISSSWLTLGASLSLLIPAWTANAQEFNLPLRPFTKVVLEPDTTVNTSNSTANISRLATSEEVTPQSVIIDEAQSESANKSTSSSTSNSTSSSTSTQKASPDPAMPQVAIATLAKVNNQDPPKLLSTTNTNIVQDSQRSQPQKVSSSTEPARIDPNSTVYESGKLDPAQTLVVPTTPSQVKLDLSKPVTLAELLELVERSSPDWIQAKIAVDRARAGLRAAEAGRSPTVSASSRYTYGNSVFSPPTVTNSTTNSTTNTSTTHALTGTLGISYNIFDSGVNDNTIAAAENSLRIAEASLNQVNQTIRLNIVTAYYSLQNADETIRIQRKAVENAERSLKDTKSRERAGVGTKFDVLQSEVSLANAKQDLLNAEASQLVARRELSRQINYPPTIEITAADKIAPVAAWKMSLEESILLAVRNRSELDIRKLEREVARNNANATLSRLGPQVSVFTNFDASTSFVNNGSASADYQVGLSLSWTLFDGGKAAAQVDQYKADQATAESKFEQAARQARYDVESAYINQRSRFQQIDTATKAVQQAEEALRLARLRLDAGVGTQLEVISAESDLTRADVNRVQAIIGYNQSRANLERAINGI
ncbi:TolC family protein [Pseudanabaena sp. UWO310]|uniref:TolC family protein n=1 Tax=Pseudanabaena sp. UWO310 TaxID=2480795 RepID=UPI001161130F|nr:TolC family protein [Pseudanabaena sp. UWO310]TYQ23430.1 TolC family protein [Pseudanabaena sp. UWO310]